MQNYLMFHENMYVYLFVYNNKQGKMIKFRTICHSSIH